MESIKRRNYCRCYRTTLPSTFLFLSWILPSSSFAQMTLPSPSHTTLSTQIANSTVNSTASATSADSAASPTDPGSDGGDDSSTLDKDSFRYNYYFLVAVLLVVFIIAIYLFGRQRKRKRALTRSNGRQALARDAEGWRTGLARMRMGRPHGGSSATNPTRIEGLDERGEAPPPYIREDDKPPSIRTVELRRPSTSMSEGESVELRGMGGDRPPVYHESEASGHEEDIGDVRRPTLAVTRGDPVDDGTRRPDSFIAADERSSSTRRLMNNSSQN